MAKFPMPGHIQPSGVPPTTTARRGGPVQAGKAIGLAGCVSARLT